VIARSASSGSLRAVRGVSGSARGSSSVGPRLSTFAPGQSPFRQKGAAYLGDFEMLDGMVQGGFAQVLMRISDPAVRAFLAQKFHASEWYDVMPNPCMQRVAAALRGVRFERHQRDTGAWHAERAVRGVYRSLLKYVSNANIALWGPRMSSIYHEFGKMRADVGEGNLVRCLRSGVPQALVTWLTPAVVGFAETALVRSGARTATLRFDPPEPDGGAAGNLLVRIAGELTWS